MKATSLKTAAVLAGISLLAGSAMAQTTSSSAAVGFETLAIGSGFNYLGLRLHEDPVVGGSFDSSTATTLVDSGVDFTTAVENGVAIAHRNN